MTRPAPHACSPVGNRAGADDEQPPARSLTHQSAGPSFCLPAVDACFDTSPSHAAKSQPFAHVSAGGAMAALAVAVIGPIPEIVISCRATSSSRAGRAISLSSTAIVAQEVLWLGIPLCGLRMPIALLPAPVLPWRHQSASRSPGSSRIRPVLSIARADGWLSKPFAWVDRNRRLTKDFERSIQSAAGSSTAPQL